MANPRNLSFLATSSNTTGFLANTRVSGLITDSQIASVANTKVTGLITNTQIASVANTKVTGTMTIAQGGTGQTTKDPAFNALSPITSTGDLIIGNGTNSATRLPIGTNGQVLQSNGTTASWQSVSSGAMSLISTQTANFSSNIQWTGLTGKKYLLLIDKLYFSTSRNLKITFGYGASPTYMTSGYSYAFMVLGTNISRNATDNASFVQGPAVSGFSSITNSIWAIIQTDGAFVSLSGMFTDAQSSGRFPLTFGGSNYILDISPLTAIRIESSQPDEPISAGIFSLYSITN